MNTSNIEISSNVDIKGKHGPSLYLNIMKNNQKYIHLSIHFCITDLDPTKQGTVHMFKNIFDNLTRNTSMTKSKLRKLKHRMYALITVHQPIDKPESLEFTIENTYLTTNMPTANRNDSQLQKEMNTILIVLNRLFNEKDTEYYIGRQKNIININNNTNNILKHMNMHNKYSTRKNKGILLGPKTSNQEPIIMKHSIKRNQKTRKVQSKYRNRKGRVNTNHSLIDEDKDYQEPGFHESVTI